MLDLAIKGGMVVTAEQTIPADVGIEGDRIAVVAIHGALPPARREINAEGLLVLPGAIDIHFHVRAPGHPQRGTFVTESRAAAAGGVTTFLEMPISVPCCATPEVFERRKHLGESESFVNFGLYGAPGLLKRDDILRMGEAGACGFKIFTHATPPGREEEFAGLCLTEEHDLYTALEYIKETGLPTSFHAENQRLLQHFEGRIRATGRYDPHSFAESRPPVVEGMSVAQIAVLCAAVGTHCHIAHVSGAWPLRELQAAQARGLPMTGETCPYYLHFTVDDLERLGPYALIKPPLRTPADQHALWDGLRSGALLAITTDHSPFTLAEKEAGEHNIWQAAIGVPGVEALVPFVMTQALQGHISLHQAVSWLATLPARLFGLAPRKGNIAVGADADLLLYSPTPEHAMDCSTWFTKAAPISRLYQGMPVCGQVHTTIVNGTVVFANGQMTLARGQGRFVAPGHS